jgi:hypothetical protein
VSPQVVVRLLPDKSGRVRIHWFCRDEKGAATTPASADPMFAAMPNGHPMKPGTKGFIACQRALTSVEPRQVNGTWQATPHTDDVRCATCPECKTTPEYQAAMAELELIESTANQK